ncbi:MAG: hypothetical protein KAI57_00045 [Candidatus Pacebacteria bacterium]|nr:hypothetical protein [Candidatus Paceibacterota bacterium]
MSNIDNLVNGINPKKKSPTKDELWNFIKNSLKQIGEINDEYKKFFEGTDEKISIIKEIEEKYTKIKESYDELFLVNDGEKNKLQEIEEKIEEIKEYHKELLEDIDDEISIKSNIDESKKYINEFYNFLFGEEKTEEKTKKLIKEINDYNDKLFNEETGLEKEIDEVYENIIEKYNNLFKSEKGEQNKIKKLDENIENINLFNQLLDGKIKLNLDEKQEYLNKLKIDIDTKRKEVSLLLSDATVQTLAQGYSESMEEYSRKKEKASKELSTKVDITFVKDSLYNLYVFFYNSVTRNMSILFNYCVFILPLIVICLILLEPDYIKHILKIKYDNNIFSGTEFIIFKSVVTIPLLWIAWFGQKNISQRKRLFEEYNHKLRVVQMYILFNEKNKSYSLKNEHKLEEVLIEVIKNNPAKHLGKGETMIDQMLEKFRIKGFYEDFKNEIIKEGVNNVNSKK